MKTNQQNDVKNIIEEKDGWFTEKAVATAECFGWGGGIYFGYFVIPGLAAQATRAATLKAVDIGIKATPFIGGMIHYATKNSSFINSIYNSTVLTPLAERAGYEAYGCTLNPGEKALAFLGSNSLLSGGVFGAIGSKICGTTTRYTIKTTEYVASKTYKGAKKAISSLWTDRVKENENSTDFLAA
jgi:hypothetical protein